MVNTDFERRQNYTLQFPETDTDFFLKKVNFDKQSYYLLESNSLEVLKCEASSYMENIKSKNPVLAENSDILKAGNRMCEFSRSSLNDSYSIDEEVCTVEQQFIEINIKFEIKVENNIAKFKSDKDAVVFQNLVEMNPDNINYNDYINFKIWQKTKKVIESDTDDLSGFNKNSLDSRIKREQYSSRTNTQKNSSSKNITQKNSGKLENAVEVKNVGLPIESKKIESENVESRDDFESKKVEGKVLFISKKVESKVLFESYEDIPQGPCVIEPERKISEEKTIQSGNLHKVSNLFKLQDLKSLASNITEKENESDASITQQKNAKYSKKPSAELPKKKIDYKLESIIKTINYIPNELTICNERYPYNPDWNSSLKDFLISQDGSMIFGTLENSIVRWQSTDQICDNYSSLKKQKCPTKNGCKVNNVVSGYDKITCMVFSRNQKYIWVGSEYGNLKQLEIYMNYKQIDHFVKLNGEEITAIEPSFDSNYLFVGNIKGYILKYDSYNRQDVLVWNLIQENLFDLNGIDESTFDDSDSCETIIDLMASSNDQFQYILSNFENLEAENNSNTSDCDKDLTCRLRKWNNSEKSYEKDVFIEWKLSEENGQSKNLCDSWQKVKSVLRKNSHFVLKDDKNNCLHKQKVDHIDL